MIPEFGHYALILALCVALIQGVLPLLGAHQKTDCSSCHKNGLYKGTSTDCFICHQTDFTKSAAANHVTGQFSHDCTTCHSMNVWKPSTFTHSATNFPLKGAHLTTDCVFCHKNGQFKGTAADCYTCHTADFMKVLNPNHVTGNFDYNCTTCHTTTAWKPATFNHNNTKFILTGAHVTTLCEKCHISGKFTGTTTDCYTCHLSDFTTAKIPDHVTGQYGYDCVSCHSTSVWQPWTYNHNALFKITSHHNNRAVCADCHRTPGNFKAFSCTTGCHSNAHNKSKVCYPCHTS